MACFVQVYLPKLRVSVVRSKLVTHSGLLISSIFRLRALWREVQAMKPVSVELSAAFYQYWCLSHFVRTWRVLKIPPCGKMGEWLDMIFQLYLYFILFVVNEHTSALFWDEISLGLVIFLSVSHSKRLKRSFYFKLSKFRILQKGSKFVLCHGT